MALERPTELVSSYGDLRRATPRYSFSIKINPYRREDLRSEESLLRIAQFFRGTFSRCDSMNESDHCIGKYGHVFNMDPSSRFEPTTKRTSTAEVHRHATGEAMTELGEVKVIAPSSSIATSTPNTSGDPAPCKNGGCKVWRSNRDGNSEPRSESPWHLLKTIFLISVIVAFLLWVIVYTLLDQYRIL